MAEQEVNPTLFEAVQSVASAAVAGVNVALPARVESYDKATQTARVTPLIGARTTEGAPVNLPTLASIPVLFPTGGGYTLSFPLSSGDTGLLVVSDRSLDEWKAGQGQRVSPASKRRHSLSDAVFLPGVLPSGAPRVRPATAEADGLYLGAYTSNPLTEKTRLEITSEGKILLGDGVADVVTILYDAINTLLTASYGPAIDGASGLALTAALVKLDNLKP